jgi:hypothetical protein
MKTICETIQIETKNLEGPNHFSPHYQTELLLQLGDVPPCWRLAVHLTHHHQKKCWKWSDINTLIMSLKLFLKLAALQARLEHLLVDLLRSLSHSCLRGEQTFSIRVKVIM